MLTVDYALLGINGGERVLDVGCGDGRHSFEAFKRQAVVYAADLGAKPLSNTSALLRLLASEAHYRGGWASLQANVTRLPFGDASFDRVICSEVLEHLGDDDHAVDELTRVLKPGGKIAVSVPTYLTETVYWAMSRDYAHQPGGHVRKYKAGQLVTLLERHGLHVYATRRMHGLHSPYWLLRCLFGVSREDAWLPSLYHRFLVWDIENKTRPLRLLHKALDATIAKSVVVYAHRADNGA